MSLAAYTGLIGELQTWLHRADVTTAQAGTFIQLFESDFNSTMRVRQMEAQTSMPSSSGYLTHPANWLGWKEIRDPQNRFALEPIGEEIASDLYYRRTGVSVAYKTLGDRTYLYPSTGGTMPASYYEGVGLTNGTNWLLTRYPGAYLYGSLLQATAFIVDDPRVPLWQAAYEQVCERIREDSRKASWGGQALQPRHTVRVV